MFRVLVAKLTDNIPRERGQGMIQANDGVRSFQRLQTGDKLLDHVDYHGFQVRNALAGEPRL